MTIMDSSDEIYWDSLDRAGYERRIEFLNHIIERKVSNMQRVIKRDGREVEFDKAKIIKAISCANQEILKSKQIGPRKINQLANIVEEKCSEYKEWIDVCKMA